MKNKNEVKHTPKQRKFTGSDIAMDLNTAIDHASVWNAGTMQNFLMAIQPDRKTQLLWDAAPELLEVAKMAHKWGILNNVTETLPWLETIEEVIIKTTGNNIFK